MANNKKTKPAAGKSAAGKSNSKKNISNDKQKQRLEAEKRAQKIIEEKQKAQKQQQKKSEEIHKRRAKENEKQQKTQQKVQQKTQRNLTVLKLKKFWKKVRYYTSREFLSSFNYFRIFVFVVLPLILIVCGIIGIFKSVPMNVPKEIRSYEYNGKLESEEAALESVFNSQQQGVFVDSVKSHGSGKFDFYINTVVEIDDNSETHNLCFGNPEENDCILIATIFDDDGRILYRSLGLESGKELNKAKMFEYLKYGMHDVTVSVNAYDQKSKEKIGTRYAEIKLAVGVEENGE